MPPAVLAVAVFAAATVSTSAQDARRDVDPTSTPGVFVGQQRDLSQLPVQSSDRVIVRFESHVDTAPLDGYLQQLGARVAEVAYGNAFHVLQVPEGTVGSWVELLGASDAVVYAEPEGIVHALGTPPNDSFWQYQWHMMDRGATSVGAVSNFGVQAPEAWNTSTGAGAVVAVVDTGVAYENFGSFQVAPDLANTSFVAGYDFVNNDTHANDDEGHGTHVAGTVAQSTDNALGCAGVAYDATIMPVKVLSSTGSGSTTWVANGIRFAADNGADVINLSLGSSAGSTTLESAVNYAWSRGCVVVAATGNSGASSIGFPARYTNCIAVGASRFDGNRSGYSQYGAGIDVTAPGGDTSIDQNGDGYPDGVLQQTFSGSPTSFGYYFFQGTSMASPHVAGIAALLRSANPSATNLQIRQAIEGTCLDRGASGYDTVYGHGIVDAAAAVAAIGGGSNPPPAAPTGLTASAGNGSVALDWANNGESDLAGYHVYRSTSGSSGSFARITSSLLGASAYTDNGVTNGVTYYYVVTAVDTAGNESGSSNQASATPIATDTTPPAAPTGFVVASRGNGRIGLDWANNAEPDLAGYYVYRWNGSAWARITGLLGASAFTHTSPPRYTWLYYTVTAVDTSGNESAGAPYVQTWTW